jgi:hypothetical protein
LVNLVFRSSALLTCAMTSLMLAPGEVLTISNKTVQRVSIGSFMAIGYAICFDR